MGERRVRNAEARGSTPLISTIFCLPADKEGPGVCSRPFFVYGQFFIECRNRFAGVTDPKGLHRIVPALLACSSLLVDKRFSGLFVAVLQRPLPFNNANSLSGAASIRRTVPFWDSPVKDTDSAAIIAMLCHFGTARGSAYGRPLADPIVFK